MNEIEQLKADIKELGSIIECKNGTIATLAKTRDKSKAENARLKEKIIKLSEEKGHLIVENNTLKEANQSLSLLGTTFASANEIVRKEFFRADKNKDMWREKAEKLQQTLQEIKAIADARCNECKYGKDGISCKYGDCGEAKLHLITQLITKAEEE